MSYLVDTNVLSELRRPKPDEHVVAWFEHRPPSALYLSVLSVGEIRKGIDAMPASARRQTLLDWLEVDLPAFFAGRILSVDEAVAHRWGRLQATAGRPVPAIDALIAATALHHGLTLVTRNTRDFGFPSLDLIDPWRA